MSPIRMERVELAIRTVLQFKDAFNAHDVAGMMQLVSEDCRFEISRPAPDGTVVSGKETATRYWEEFFRESPQAHIEIEDIFSFANRCVMRWRREWSEAAEQKGHLRGVDLFQVKDGLISERLSYVKG